MKYPIKVTEEREIKRITLKKSIVDLLNAFNMERGIIYTVKMLLLNPGSLMREYLGVGRYRIVSSFRLLVLTTALSLLIMNLSGFDEFLTEIENTKNQEETISGKSLSDFFFNWYNLLLWAAIPIFAIFSFLFNRSYKYNFAEHLVLQAYYFGTFNLFYVIIFPMNLFIDGVWVLSFLFLLATFYYYYFISSFFQNRRFSFFAKNIFAYIFAYLVYNALLLFTIDFFFSQS